MAEYKNMNEDTGMRETESETARRFEERLKMPEYELHILVRLPNEEALVALMKKLADPIYEADYMAMFSGGEYDDTELA